MKTFQVYSQPWPENKTPERELRGGMRCVVVVCRKPCHCAKCHFKIKPGEKALKTSYWRIATQQYIRRAYCAECFVEKAAP